MARATPAIPVEALNYCKTMARKPVMPAKAQNQTVSPEVSINSAVYAKSIARRIKKPKKPSIKR